jgi:hypothetical protein
MTSHAQNICSDTKYIVKYFLVKLNTAEGWKGAGIDAAYI